MGNEVKIDRWIDLDSADGKRLEYHSRIKKIVSIGIEEGAILIDSLGLLWTKETKKPVHAELDGKFIGLKYAAKAPN